MRRVLGIVLAQTALFGLMSGNAHAINSKAAQVTYFDAAAQVIGETLVYCSGDSRHWGQAVQGNRSNVTVYYGCSDASINVSFDIGLPLEVRQIFCIQWQDVCTQPGPWPVQEQGSNPLLPGRYTY